MTATLIVLSALVLAMLQRRRSAALRHCVLATAMMCALIAPVLVRVLPAWPAPFRVLTLGDARAVHVVPAPPIRADAGRAPSAVAPPRSTAGPAATRRFASADAAATVWTAGFAIGLAVLLIGFARLTWIASRASPADARWVAIADAARAAAGVRRSVVLLQSDHPSLLVTWGLVRPRIILPAGAAAWPDALMRTVIGHEMAHIERGDWAAQLGGSVLRAMHWFNPIVWVACRRLRLESEYACDALVMSRGVSAADYAAHLLDLARTLNRRRAWVPAPAMARPSSLERRITVMLNDTVDRRPVSASTRGAIFVALSILTAVVASAQAFGTLVGSIVDPLGAPVPGVVVTMTDSRTGEKREVRSGPTGAYEFVGLPQGEYQLQAAIPGFATSREQLTVAGQTIQRPIALQLGSVHETITVSDEPPTRTVTKTLTPRATPPCGAAAGANARVGGNVRPPRKVRHVPPVFPPQLRGTEGEVVMDGRIALDGFVRDLQVRAGANPDFARAATDAVSQWQFDSTLLNCVPMEVAIGITVRFVRQP